MSFPTSYDSNSPEEALVALPSAPLVTLSPTLTYQPPLTRHGAGPGLLIFSPNLTALPIPSSTLDPVPQQKWAEEGYGVVWCDSQNSATADIKPTLQKAIKELQARKEINIKDKFAVIGRPLKQDDLRAA